MDWYVWIGLIIGIIIMTMAIYYTLTQLSRVIRQARKDWSEGITEIDVYKMDIENTDLIKREAAGNMRGAIIAGICASLVISSYGWFWPFLFLGPILSLLAGAVCLWCFWTERRDCKRDGKLA